MIEYDESLVEQVAHTLDLRRPNRDALDALAQALAAAETGAELVADLATGVGKTYIAGALLDYLYASGLSNVVIVTPGSTIQRKTVDNLTPGHRKYLRGLQSNPLVVTLDSLERGEVGAALQDTDRFKVFVLTVQSLLRPNTNDARRAYREHETTGVALYDYLQAADDLVVIADEHHVYYSNNAKKFRQAIEQMHPQALIGLTATPHEAAEPKIVYRYPLSSAIADGYVKIPVLVSRRDGISDLRTQLADGLTLLAAKAATMRAYCNMTKQAYAEPILFIVASTIDEANEIRDTLAGSDMLGTAEQVLLVTSEEPDKTLALLDTLEDPDSPIRAVVSVGMLKEGWDVKNVYVIASVRSLESTLLTEQVLGRGLRLPFGTRTGNPMLDTVEVLSHRSFAALLRQAKVLLEETLGKRTEEATITTNPVPGIIAPGVPLGAGDVLPVNPDEAGSISVNLPGVSAAYAEEHDGDGHAQVPGQTHTGIIFATPESRSDAARASEQAVAHTVGPTPQRSHSLPLFIPRVIRTTRRAPFSLADLDLTQVEALGRQFANDEGESLRRTALNAEYDLTGEAHVVITEQRDRVAASAQLIPYGSIETDLVGRLLRTDGIEASVREANAAQKVAQVFLDGARVTESTPWRVEHGRLATARLTEWIKQRHAATRTWIETSVLLDRWPDPQERIEVQPPADRHLVTSSSVFARGYPYSGWERSFYDVVRFDAYSTEFRLAELFDASSGVESWLRVDEHVPLRIDYSMGAYGRQYEPDFVVIDDERVHWIIEGKRDSEVTSAVVEAKRDAAREWLRAVNEDSAVSDRWGYLLASESVVANSSSWFALRRGAQTFS
ncbi:MULTISPECIES: DEAD/DEAH box helicase family protein [unclassified Nocardioides]|uniref:DEAD/DEAH box helicase n=1 Tax=unclassified Nocardioides TaxID=2615069 RepID=UPI0000571865|nr:MULTISPECIES: DEAD/DEAH box helicase family protein [unclassified Nocardioides]ABL80603.1 type III restriction enzyme, res subunit [Nocardioides sp. JS614]